MKNLSSLIINSLFTVILSVSLMMCFSTSFNIEVNLFLLIFSAIIFTSIISLISYYISSGKKFFAAVAVIQAVYIAVFFTCCNTIISQPNYAANRLLGVYSKYMEVPSSINIAASNAISEKSSEATVLFIFILFILCEIFSLSLIRLKKSILIYIFSLIILVPCFIIVTTLPSVTPLIISVSILLALYITGFVRRYSEITGSAVLSVTSIILAITLSVLCAVFPLQEYKRYEWQDALLNQFNVVLNNDTSENPAVSKLQNLNANVQDSQNLANLGEFRLDKAPVLSVMNDDNSVMYLKKIAYADYDDNQWKILSKDEAKSFPTDFSAFDITRSTDTNLKQLLIKSLYREDLIYTTYYSKRTEYGAVADACIENIDNEKEYLIEYYSDNYNRLVKNESDKIDEYESFVYSTYTKLPNKTKERLLEIADRNGLSDLIADEIPQAVKEFIMSRGEYSFIPDAMPKGDDFAPWFIESNSKGYCVHYATSAATLLRALGIPARYVTGYFAPTLKNQFVDVTNCNSHAWVEYYDKSKGWVMLDATPPAYLNNSNYSNTSNTKSTDSTNSSEQTEQTTLSANEQPTTNKSFAPTQTSSHNKGNSDTVPTVVWIALGIFLIIAVILFRSYKIQNIRKKLFENGDNKKRIINIYRYALNINRITEGFIPIEVQNLVNEAKYSNHTMPDKAVEIVLNFAEQERKTLYKNAVGIKRLYYKYIRVL